MNVDFAEKSYQTAIDDITEPEEDCDEDELDDWIQEIRTEAIPCWQCADELEKVVKVLAPRRILEKQLIAIARNIGAGIFSAIILKQLMLCDQVDKKLIVDEFYNAFLNYYVESNVRDRPVAQFLYQCAKLENNKTIKRVTNF